MSIAIVVSVHDGIVIAADSASSLMVSLAPPAITGVANVYEHGNKIFNLLKVEPIGCVTFGSGSIGNSSIGTLIKDFRQTLSNSSGAKGLAPPFDKKNYTMEGVAQNLASFLRTECSRLEASLQAGIDLGIFLAGYSTGKPLGESWGIEIQRGVVAPPHPLRRPEDAGINWGGTSEVIHRIVLGYDPKLFEHLAKVTTPEPGKNEPPTPDELSKKLTPILAPYMQAALVFAPMPIQDAIDLARFLVHAAIMYSRFLPGVPVVGGQIEIASITKHEGFKWISRKHYYDYSINREPIHVIVDDKSGGD